MLAQSLETQRAWLIQVKKENHNRTLISNVSGRPFEIKNFDDLVFEHRNRDYGAYQLRKRYPRVLFAAILISIAIAATVVFIPFLFRSKQEIAFGGGRGGVMISLENLAPPEEQIFIPPAAPPPPQPERMQEMIEYIPPVVVDSILPNEATLLSAEDILSSVDSEITDVAGYGFGEGSGSGPGSGGGDLEEPLFQVEVMPSFRGADLSKFREWVGKRTNYPQAAIQNKIRGTVYLTFIVEKDGSVSSVTILKGVHPLLDNEAVKVISESPKWTPGLQRGQPVRVRFQIPLSFIY